MRRKRPAFASGLGKGLRKILGEKCNCDMRTLRKDDCLVLGTMYQEILQLFSQSPRCRDRDNRAKSRNGTDYALGSVACETKRSLQLRFLSQN